MIKTETAIQLVTKALNKVADFSGGIEDFPTNHLHDAHIKAFLTALDKFIREEPVVDNQGNTHLGLMYSVPLSITLFKTWQNFGDCIKHVANKYDISQK